MFLSASLCVSLRLCVFLWWGRGRRRRRRRRRHGRQRKGCQVGVIELEQLQTLDLKLQPKTSRSLPNQTAATTKCESKARKIPLLHFLIKKRPISTFESGSGFHPAAFINGHHLQLQPRQLKSMAGRGRASACSLSPAHPPSMHNNSE